MKKDNKEKDLNKVKQGKKNRASGRAFELKVRHDLENNGWIVSKWQNNVEFTENKLDIIDAGTMNLFKEGKLIAAKHKFNPFMKVMAMGTGFPDFIIFRRIKESNDYEIIGLEVKSNGQLSKEEKEKCRWYLDNKIFNHIWIASKGEKRGEIIYKDYE